MSSRPISLRFWWRSMACSASCQLRMGSYCQRNETAIAWVLPKKSYTWSRRKRWWWSSSGICITRNSARDNINWRRKHGNPKDCKFDENSSPNTSPCSVNDCYLNNFTSNNSDGTVTEENIIQFEVARWRIGIKVNWCNTRTWQKQVLEKTSHTTENEL